MMQGLIYIGRALKASFLSAKTLWTRAFVIIAIFSDEIGGETD